MWKLITTTILAFFLAATAATAQQDYSFVTVDSTTYALYEKAAWKELLIYGKDAIANNQDFSYLRLRLGYAAFMTGNYAEALRHYKKVLQEDSYNSTAHYFIYWSRINLNQPELAMAEIKYLSPGMLPGKNTNPAAITGVELEFSYKQTTAASRQNPLYARFGLGNRFGYGVHMQQSIATYQQKISEPLLTAVTNNANININQFEYYNRLLFNLGRGWQLKTAWHYLYTPFNNFKYNNHLVLAGLKYNGNYFDLQADAVLGTLTDTSQQQYNLQLGLYPLGNFNLYSFSTASIRQREGESAFNFRQVLGVKIIKNIWLEGHITAGEFRNLAENDALYVYHAIDPNKSKAGITSYIFLGGTTILQLGYTHEKRQLFGTTTTFQQHSITGGLSWKF